MTEPVEVAQRAERIAEGVWHWRIANSAIGGATSSCQLFQLGDDVCLIDPVQLEPTELAELPRPTAILLTSKGHQRSAWHYRRQFGAPVWMPEGTPKPDEEPDHRYRAGDRLPGGFEAVLTPGPAALHFCLLRGGDPQVLVCSDLLMGGPDEVEYVPLEFHDDPQATRRSVEGLLELPFTLLCLDHGEPVKDGKAAIARLVATE